MQKFEVGEMYIFGRPTSFFSPANCDFLSASCDDFESDYNYNTCIFSKFHFSIISAKEFRGLKFSGKLIQTRIESQQRYDESSSFLYILMKRQNFRFARERKTPFRRVENGSTYRLLSLII